MHQTNHSITEHRTLFLSPTGHIHARPRQVEVLEQRNQILVENLNRALERIRVLTELLLEERR